MFEPNALMSAKDCPNIQIPVRVFHRKGIRGESWKNIWTEESWEQAMGETYQLHLNWGKPTALYRRTENGMMKEPQAALKNFVLN